MKRVTLNVLSRHGCPLRSEASEGDALLHYCFHPAMFNGSGQADECWSPSHNTSDDDGFPDRCPLKDGDAYTTGRQSPAVTT